MTELETLRTEVERLLAREGGIDQLDAQIAELRAALAAANALLDEWLTVDAAASNTPRLLLDRVHAHLAAQPAKEDPSDACRHGGSTRLPAKEDE